MIFRLNFSDKDVSSTLSHIKAALTFTGQVLQFSIGVRIKEESVMTKALVTNKKYEGKYVAFPIEGRKMVVASGENYGDVVKRARKKGVKTPAVMYVPKGNVTCIY